MRAKPFALALADRFRRVRREPRREQRRTHGSLRAAEERWERRAPDPVPQLRLRLGVARAEQEERAVDLCDLWARPIRGVGDDAVEEHLRLAPLGRHLQGEPGREQERVRRLRVLGPEADELEDLPPRLVVAILPECRPRDAEPRRAGLRMAGELDERA